MNVITGGCLCGAVRYRCGAPLNPATLCHCRSCRRASGAHALGLVTVARDGLQFTAEHPQEYRSSAAVVRTFCPRCGTPVSYWHEGWPGDISLTIGSLDRPECTPPEDHTWMSDAVAWDVPVDGLKRFPEDR